MVDDVGVAGSTLSCSGTPAPAEGIRSKEKDTRSPVDRLPSGFRDDGLDETAAEVGR